jgi:endonuclease VIII
MPEGDSLHRIARRLQPLVGERVEAESPHPRGAATGVARAVDGRVLEHVGALGKHLILRFEGGVVVRSHLRMSGRWRVDPRGRVLRGRPWLVLRGTAWEATQWNGPVLALGDVPSGRVGPDLLAPETEPSTIVTRIRRLDQSRLLGEVLVDQRVVAGVGNMWLAEALWQARLSPWSAVGDVTDAELNGALTWARDEMRAAVLDARPPHNVHRKAGRPCPRCGERIRSRGLGDANRTAYWCPACQPTVDSAEREGFEPSTSGLPPVTP